MPVLGGAGPGRDPLFDGPARPERLYRRIHHPAGRVRFAHYLGDPGWPLAATLGVILAAIYLLSMFEKVFLGRAMQEENPQLQDMTPARNR